MRLCVYICGCFHVLQCLVTPGKLTVAWTGALVATEAWTRCGYFSLNQAAREPGYDPPNATNFLLVRPRASAVLVTKWARSARAWRLLRKRRLSVLRSLDGERGSSLSSSIILSIEDFIKAMSRTVFIWKQRCHLVVQKLPQHLLLYSRCILIWWPDGLKGIFCRLSFLWLNYFKVQP